MEDIRYWRTGAGTIAASIPQRHTHHSPTGFEVGYGGSGPADFALNILAVALPIRQPTRRVDPVAGEWGNEPPVWLGDGTQVSAEAWALHQAFKWDVIARLPAAGGTIPAEAVATWIARERATVASDGAAGDEPC